MEDFNRAIEIDPRNVYALKRRAEMHGLEAFRYVALQDAGLAIQRLDRAIADFQRAMDIEPSNSVTKQLLDNMKRMKQQVMEKNDRRSSQAK
jgi:tetratricopeptide (TPR) repeat protein